MPNAQYRAGRRLEYDVMGDLITNGYVCTRTAGSHGAYDVIAMKRGETLLIQCKTDGTMPRADRLKLTDLAAKVDAVPLLAWWHKEGRAARALAYHRLLSAEPGDMTPWRGPLGGSDGAA